MHGICEVILCTRDRVKLALRVNRSQILKLGSRFKQAYKLFMK